MRITARQLRQVIKEEMGRRLTEADDEMGGGSGGPDMTIDTWNKMPRKPVGFIVDLEWMMASGGGYYPLYFSDGKQIVKISDDIGEVAYSISEMLGERGRLPAGMWVAGSSDGGDGPYEITNRV